MNVQRAVAADIVSLASAFGNEAYFADRYQRQRAGRGVLFVAFLENKPVGDVYLWLEPAEEEEIRTHLRGVALLTHLEVLPEFRNRGIGTQLIDAVEARIWAMGRQKVALAVRDDNVKAADLYKRLDYVDWGYGKLTCHTEVGGPDGTREPESCYVMVKQLHSVSASSDNAFASLAD
ncbi:MAG TPA: GNAT family N-acetyltransferase [Pseudonocardiaceae bacterium]|jgi:ribosomal protein S18 acetylase RimI-like enzyme|nr:GNAT family N-acetyltransferase [Pseudonocardiaceae bacterium]